MNTFEDIPDIEGDRRYGYASIAQELGPVKTAYICLAAFFLAYTILIFLQLLSPHLFNISLGILGSATLLALFCFRFGQLIDRIQTDVTTVKLFYRFLWQLYCAQYLLLPILFRYPPLS
jgi:homogentisate phytyltransferase/homogentisate geranylgeranyltransferase